jgi:hypothetical protein
MKQTKQTKTSLLAKTLILAALPACALLGVGGIAAAQVEVQVGFAPPPPTYVATAEPVYYNGQPAYWYQNHWYWRDGGGRWSYYREEPAFLRDHRMHREPVRHMEEHRGHEEHRGGRR